MLVTDLRASVEEMKNEIKATQQELASKLPYRRVATYAVDWPFQTIENDIKFPAKEAHQVKRLATDAVADILLPPVGLLLPEELRDVKHLIEWKITQKEELMEKKMVKVGDVMDVYFRKNRELDLADPLFQYVSETKRPAKLIWKCKQDYSPLLSPTEKSIRRFLMLSVIKVRNPMGSYEYIALFRPKNTLPGYELSQHRQIYSVVGDEKIRVDFYNMPIRPKEQAQK
jgi:hypothetical protein